MNQRKIEIDITRTDLLAEVVNGLVNNGLHFKVEHTDFVWLIYVS